MKVFIMERKLSDDSKIYDVVIAESEDASVCFRAFDEKHALRLAEDIYNSALHNAVGGVTLD